MLHASARDKVAQLGGTRAIARALAGYDTFGDVMLEDELPERLFLLGRIGFLVTLERDEAVKVIVDQEEAIKSLVYVSGLIRWIASLSHTCALIVALR